MLYFLTTTAHCMMIKKYLMKDVKNIANGRQNHKRNNSQKQAQMLKKI